MSDITTGRVEFQQKCVKCGYKYPASTVHHCPTVSILPPTPERTGGVILTPDMADLENVRTTFTCSHGKNACGMCAEQITALTKERDRYREALEEIEKLAILSNSRRGQFMATEIARAALNPEKEG